MSVSPSLPGQSYPPRHQSRASQASYTTSRYWWLHPSKVLAFLLIPLYCLMYVWAPEDVLLGFQRFFTGSYFWLGLAYLLMVLLGSCLAVSLRYGQPSLARVKVPSFYLDMLAWLTVAAYLLWFRDIFRNPGLLFTLLRGDAVASNALRNFVTTIPGVTTLSQLGVVYMVFYSYRRFVLRLPQGRRRFDCYAVLIVGLTLFRALVWAERLALIEVFLATAVVLISFRPPASRLLRLALRFAPLLGFMGLVLIFGAFEFYRSWAAWHQFSEASFWDFVLLRIARYYYTALNNGAGVLHTGEWPDWRLMHTFSWFYRFPILGEVFFRGFEVTSPVPVFLQRFGVPEFTNASGIFTVFYDLGSLGGLLYGFAFGVLLGYSYKTCLRMSGLGVVLYPALYMGLLEIFRILYLGESRAFPIVAFLLLGYALNPLLSPKASRKLRSAADAA